MNAIVYVFLGGGLGSVVRFLLSKSISSNFTHINPVSTLLSNFIASLVLAILIYYFNEKQSLDWGWKLFLITGFCGGFSTFSTFSYETYELFRLHMPLFAILNILISVGLGVLLMFFIHKFI